MEYKNLYLIFSLFLSSGIQCHNYVHGNGFRAIADYLVEDNSHNFNAHKVESRSIIYIESNFFEYFFEKVFPDIKNPIILVTHNSDWPAPGKFAKYLEDERIIIWFGQNCDLIHPKFYPIPIGIANPKWGHGNPKIFDEVRDEIKKHPKKKKSLLYLNFASTNPLRPQLMEYFKDKPFVHFASPKPVKEYLLDMARYKFVLSPFGNGLDCHRTWEALLVGSIPVVKTSTLNALYEDLPVVIVQNWEDINPVFLKEYYKLLKNKKINREKLFMQYWSNLITSYKNL